VRQIRHRVSREVLKQLVTSLLLSRLDYCNAILAGLPESSLPFQRAQNAAARLMLGLDRRSSITTALMRDLHWLPAGQAPHHLQSRNSDASSSSSSLSSVLGWPRRV